MTETERAWIQLVLEKQSLGHHVAEDDCQHWTKDWMLNTEQQQHLQDFWLKLCRLSFLPLESLQGLTEIQGHHAKHFDLIYQHSKQNVVTDLDPLVWKALLQYFCLKEKVAWNNSVPFVSFASTVQNHSCRISLQHASLSPTGKDKIFFRFHTQDNLPLHSFTTDEDLPLLLPLLQKSICERKDNILICGPTGSGKTSLLRSLTQLIEPDEHLITLEDTAELHLKRLRHTSLIAQAQASSVVPVTLDELCAYAMRMTPDRLILGEIRGKEIIALSLLLNTGHQGLMATVHATSATDALHRLALLFCLNQPSGQGFSFEGALQFLAKQFQRVIFLKDKKIQEIIQLIGAEGSNIFLDNLYKSKRI